MISNRNKVLIGLGVSLVGFAYWVKTRIDYTLDVHDKAEAKIKTMLKNIFNDPEVRIKYAFAFLNKSKDAIDYDKLTETIKEILKQKNYVAEFTISELKYINKHLDNFIIEAFHLATKDN